MKTAYLAVVLSLGAQAMSLYEYCGERAKRMNCERTLGVVEHKIDLIVDSATRNQRIRIKRIMNGEGK